MEKNLNIKKNNLIEFYKKYIYLEDLNSTKIDPSKAHLISEQLFFNFSQLKEDEENNLILKLEEQQKIEIKKKFPIQLNNTGKDENRIYLFFPLLKVVERNKKSSKEFLYPLFAIDITDYKKEEGFDIPIEFISSSEYQPIFNSFNKFLGIEEDVFSENVSISYLLNNLMKTKLSSAKNILEYFLKYLNSYVRGGEIFSKFGVISKLDMNNLSKNLKYELDIIKSTDIANCPLIEDYLFKRHDYKKENVFIEDNKSLWYGTFGNHPLSRGQARVLQSIKNNRMISVMGAPGTGKTTLFLSVIASQIVDRALSNIYKGKDKKNLMFITSTSNKAVSNVIEDFKTLFKDRKDFYFIGGKKENIEESKNRILNYLEDLENDEFVFDPERMSFIEKEIKEIMSKLDQYQEVFIKREIMLTEKKDIDKKYLALKGIRDDLKKMKGKELEEVFLKKKIEDLILKETELEKKKTLYKSKKETIDYVYKNLEKTYGFKKEFLLEKDLNSILKGPFLKELNDIGRKIVSINPFYSIFEFIFKKKEEILNIFLEENKEYTDGMTTKITINNILTLADLAERLMFYYEKELKDIELDDLKSIDLLDEEIDSFFKERIGLSRKEIETKKEIEELKRKETESKYLFEEIDLQKKMVKEYELELVEFKNILSKGKFLTNVFREDFVNENRKLYELSNEYLRLKAIKEKKKVIYYLRLWVDLLEDKKSKEEKKFIDFEEMYQTISLIYPVITSTLASVSNNIKTDLFNKRKIKPFSLCLVDEAGMISIPSLLPALFRSDKAIVVGDPKQLEAIVTLSETNRDELTKDISNADDFYQYSPTESNAYHRAAGCITGSYSDIGAGILLDEHRRCQPDIANLFKEIAGYRRLKIETLPLTDIEEEKLKKLNFKNLNFINIEGKQGKYDNTNIAEIERIKILLNDLENAGVDIKKEVGIITPFSNQESLLIEFFGRNLYHSYGNEKIGTVHKFQGAEFNYIIFSSVIYGTYNKASFINLKPNLLNVAISRAKHCFIHVGDEKTIRNAGGYLGIMMKHYDINGTIN